ncbi:MAG: hypothetical protein ABR587_03550 [Candidatus Binatia bacterium]
MIWVTLRQVRDLLGLVQSDPARYFPSPAANLSLEVGTFRHAPMSSHQARERREIQMVQNAMGFTETMAFAAALAVALPLAAHGGIDGRPDV